MMNRKLGLGALLLFAASSVCASPFGGKLGDTMPVSGACDHLRTVISKQLGARHGDDEYRCEDAKMGPKDYYVFSLRSNYPSPKGGGPDWVGSGLVGWYAVRESDGQVRDWNIANFTLGTVIK